MSKELTPLEALESIKSTWGGYCPNAKKECFDIIETALKNYEYQTKLLEKLTEPKLPILSKKEVEQLKKSSGYIAEYKGVYVDENTYKKLKALEIIKEKRVNVGDFVFYQSINKVDDIVLSQETIFDLCDGGCKNGHLTQEEYDLLREVLL